MATALAGGLVNIISASDIIAYDIIPETREKFHSATGIKISNSLEFAIDFSNVLIIAVKPQNFIALFESIGTRASQKLIISIMAGIKISALMEKSTSQRIIRVMPNTPALVGKGASAYCISAATSKTDAELGKKILDSVGSSFFVDEKMMDAVTALSGSGPAYVFEFIESLAKSGEAVGLPYDLALKLATDTVEGATILLKKSKLTPEELKNNVTSPGGTTAKALDIFNQRKFRDTVATAVKAAYMKSIELGSEK